jgi:hypothetical protein
MLTSEVYFTEKRYLKLPNSTAYHTNHAAETARGGPAIIIKNSIKHQPNNCSQDFFQATSVSVEDLLGLLTILAVYTVKQKQLEDFYNILGCQFIAGGDYNAKHTDWGSRHYTQRTRSSQNDGKKQLKIPIYWRTHILAI